MSASGSRALAAVCVGVLWTTEVPVASAAPTPEPSAVTRRVLLLAASAAEERALGSVRADLQELVVPVALRAPQAERRDKRSLSRLTRAHGALAAVWLDQTSSRFVIVYVFDPASERLGMRRLPRRGQAEAEESIGVVLRATVEALLEGREAPLEVVALPAEPEPKAEVAVAPPERRERASLRTGYVGVGFADTSVEHGASFGGSFSVTRLLRLGISYALVQPAELTTSEASVTLTRRPLDAFVSLGFGFAGLELFVDAGSSIDFRERQTEVSDRSLRSTTGDSYAVVSVLGRLRLARELWPQLRFDFGPALEVPLNEPALVVERAGADDAFSHYKVRPRLELGISLVIR